MMQANAKNSPTVKLLMRYREYLGIQIDSPNYLFEVLMKSHRYLVQIDELSIWLKDQNSS